MTDALIPHLLRYIRFKFVYYQLFDYLYQRIIKTRGPRHAQHRALHVVSPTVVVTVVVVVRPCRDGTSWQLIVVNVNATHAQGPDYDLPLRSAESCGLVPRTWVVA